MNDVFERLYKLGPLLTEYPIITLIVFASPFVVLAAFKRIRPSNLLLLGMLAASLFNFSILISNDALPFILVVDTVLGILAAIDAFTLPSRKALACQRQALRVVSLQKPHRVTLQIVNQSNRPIRLRIRDDAPQGFAATPDEFARVLAPRSRTSLQYDFSASRRGAFEMNRVYVECQSRWRLWTRLMEYPVNSVFHVYPDMRQLAQYAVMARTNRLSLLGVRRTRRIGTDNDFERLRDYTFDDNYKHLDWRSTARRNKLTVKDFQTSQSQRLIFMIDCGRMMTNESGGISLLDHALNAMLMLAWVALKQGDSVGLMLFSDRILAYVPPSSGMGHMNQLLHASFDKFPEVVESRYDLAFLHLNRYCRKRSLVVLATNVIDEVNAHQIHSYLLNLVGKHLPMAVLMRDHSLFDIADGPTNTAEALYRAGAAAEILNWRHQVLTDLEHAGVLMLDTFPEDMTAPLINQYLAVKARNML